MGKKYKLNKKLDIDEPTSSAQLLTSSSGSDSDVPDSGVNAYFAIMSATKVTKQKDCLVKKATASGHSRSGDQTVLMLSDDEHSSGGLQALFLKELQRVKT